MSKVTDYYYMVIIGIICLVSPAIHANELCQDIQYDQRVIDYLIKNVKPASYDKIQYIEENSPSELSKLVLSGYQNEALIGPDDAICSLSEQNASSRLYLWRVLNGMVGKRVANHCGFTTDEKFGSFGFELLDNLESNPSVNFAFAEYLIKNNIHTRQQSIKLLKSLIRHDKNIFKRLTELYLREQKIKRYEHYLALRLSIDISPESFQEAFQYLKQLENDECKNYEVIYELFSKQSARLKLLRHP
ncbi:MAG: hypothetical protein ACWA5R_13970 [bacterium]